MYFCEQLQGIFIKYDIAYYIIHRGLGYQNRVCGFACACVSLKISIREIGICRLLLKGIYNYSPDMECFRIYSYGFGFSDTEPRKFEGKPSYSRDGILQETSPVRGCCCGSHAANYGRPRTA